MFGSREVNKEVVLNGQKEEYIFFEVVGEVGEDEGLGHLYDFEIVFVNGVDDIVVVDDGDVAFEIVKVLAEPAESLFDFLQFLVLLRVDEFE